MGWGAWHGQAVKADNFYGWTLFEVRTYVWHKIFVTLAQEIFIGHTRNKITDNPRRGRFFPVIRGHAIQKPHMDI